MVGNFIFLCDDLISDVNQYDTNRGGSSKSLRMIFALPTNMASKIHRDRKGSSKESLFFGLSWLWLRGLFLIAMRCILIGKIAGKTVMILVDDGKSGQVFSRQIKQGAGRFVRRVCKPVIHPFSPPLSPYQPGIAETGKMTGNVD